MFEEHADEEREVVNGPAVLRAAKAADFDYCVNRAYKTLGLVRLKFVMCPSDMPHVEYWLRSPSPATCASYSEYCRDIEQHGVVETKHRASSESFYKMIGFEP